MTIVTDKRDSFLKKIKTLEKDSSDLEKQVETLKLLLEDQKTHTHSLGSKLAVYRADPGRALEVKKQQLDQLEKFLDDLSKTFILLRNLGGDSQALKANQSALIKQCKAGVESLMNQIKPLEEGAEKVDAVADRLISLLGHRPGQPFNIDEAIHKKREELRASVDEVRAHLVYLNRWLKSTKVLKRKLGVKSHQSIGQMLDKRMQEVQGRVKMLEKLEKLAPFRQRIKALIPRVYSFPEVEGQSVDALELRIKGLLEQRQACSGVLAAGGLFAEAAQEQAEAIEVEIEKGRDRLLNCLLRELFDDIESDSSLKAEYERVFRLSENKYSLMQLKKELVPIRAIEAAHQNPPLTGYHPLLPKPPKLTHKKSAQEIIDEGGELKTDAKMALGVLGHWCPNLCFTGLSEDEIVRVAEFVQSKISIPPGESWLEFVDAAHAILRPVQKVQDPIPEAIKRAAGILIAAEKDRKGKTYSPDLEVLQRVAMGLILVKKQFLMERNVPLYTLDPKGIIQRGIDETLSVANSKIQDGARTNVDLGVLYGLMGVQAVVEKRDMVERIDEMTRALEALIEFHADLVLKCRAAGKKLSDFGIRRARSIAFFRSIVGYAKFYGKITQQGFSTSLETFHRYCHLLEEKFEEFPELKSIAGQPMNRKPQDVDSAFVESVLKLDDKPRLNIKRGDDEGQLDWDLTLLQKNKYSSFQVINLVYGVLIGAMEHGPAEYERATDSNLSVMSLAEVAKPVIEFYFNLNDDQRGALKKKCAKQAVNIRLDQRFQLQVIDRFFEILDAYLLD